MALKNQQASIQGLENQIGQLANQDKEGLVTPKPEARQETKISKGKGEVDHNEQKPVSSHFVWEMKQSPFKLAIPATHQKLKEMSLKEVHEPFSSNSRGPIHEEQRLQIDDLDEWRTHKLRTYGRPKLCQNKLNTFPNQLKVGDKFLLDAADHHIVTAKPDEEIPLMVLSIFPFGTVEVSHPKFGIFKVNNTYLKPYFDEIHSRNEEYKLLEPP
ncbi:hypothetical protein GOBAR_AA02626 [Gossypium barbadense]|uniref:Uncharacterized protein n=1 Tax=Gossypium barbadense TaxID=3634 RepID=A0A2P5YQV8_GOSBA|nr:hypothetical protein GOBAR_AA02626 [Gossypium barbadense]